jgi:hypothetical protein
MLSLLTKLAQPRLSSKANTPTSLRKITLLLFEMESSDSLKTSSLFKLISSEESPFKKILTLLPPQPTTSQKSNINSMIGLVGTDNNKTDKEEIEGTTTEEIETTKIEIIGLEETIERTGGKIGDKVEEKIRDKVEEKTRGKAEEKIEEKTEEVAIVKAMLEATEEKKVLNAKTENPIIVKVEKEETIKAFLIKGNLEDKTTEEIQTEISIEIEKIEEAKGRIEMIEEDIEMIERIETNEEEKETTTETIELLDNTNRSESKIERRELLLLGIKLQTSLQEKTDSILMLR